MGVDASVIPAPAEPGPLPSGTVTFAFTDIEGSTQRWERSATAMQAAARRHDDLMRSAIPQELARLTAEGAVLPPEAAIALALEDP